MGGIFLSYRRDDTAGYSGRLADALRDSFGEDVVFLDVDAIAPGSDFVRAMTSAVENADVVLAVIGRRWLTARNSARRRRIDDPDDYVRLEITVALERDRKIIPVLVDGARLPRPQDLPEPMKPLLRHNAIELSDNRWGYDLGVLLDELRPTSLPTEEHADPVPEGPGRPTSRRLRVRLGLVGLLGALLVGGLVANYEPGRNEPQIVAEPASQDSPTSTAPASTLPSSSVPEPGTATSVATAPGGGGGAAPQPRTAPSSPPPSGPPAAPPAPAPTSPPARPSYPYESRSGDGAFGAHKTQDGNHYTVRTVSTGDLVLTTHPQYADDPSDANNDVKAAMFCPGSNVFAATYHYWGGTGIYSWIGHWSTATGAFVGGQSAEGEIYAPSLGGYCSG